MKILNLGCGTKTSNHPDVDNIDFSIKLRIRRNRLLRTAAKYVLSESRTGSIESLPSNIRVHDLRKGIPYSDCSVDVVYHSHYIEHIERGDVETSLRETYRVLRPGGIFRVVFPDMERLCRAYIDHIDKCDDESEKEKHEAYIDRIIGQIARVESATTRGQRPVLRLLENLVLGDARRKGEAHMWMYDRISLSVLLFGIGFSSTKVVSYKTSSIPNWSDYGLDFDSDGTEYKPRSQYIEAIK